MTPQDAVDDGPEPYRWWTADWAFSSDGFWVKAGPVATLVFIQVARPVGIMVDISFGRRAFYLQLVAHAKP